MTATIDARTADVATAHLRRAPAAQTPRVLVVTGGDDQQMPLMRQMLTSLRALPGKDGLPVACLDLGLSEAHRRELAALRVDTVTPVHRFQVPGGPWPGWLDAYLAQPFLPETLPGWDVYLWIDADIWFQDAEGIDAAVAGALDTGLAIAHERTPMYRTQWWLTAWMAKHFVLGQGVPAGLWLTTRPHLNSGFYAARAGIPFWSAWTEALRAVDRALRVADAARAVRDQPAGARRPARRAAAAGDAAGADRQLDRRPRTADVGRRGGLLLRAPRAAPPAVDGAPGGAGQVDRLRGQAHRRRRVLDPDRAGRIACHAGHDADPPRIGPHRLDHPRLRFVAQRQVQRQPHQA